MVVNIKIKDTEPYFADPKKKHFIFVKTYRVLYKVDATSGQTGRPEVRSCATKIRYI